jgi:hypothetical protein
MGKQAALGLGAWGSKGIAFGGPQQREPFFMTNFS